MTSELLRSIALWLILAWPLLVALPGVYRRLPRPYLLALAPATLLVIGSDATGLDMPWIVFGSGLELDTGRRWLLAMTLVLWLLAGRAVHRSPAPVPGVHTLLLITFSGQTGMILASEPIGFLCFATLLSYGFFGLLVQGADGAARLPARMYVGLLILADLLLFEAPLVAAYVQGTLRFAGFDFHLQGDSAGLYTALVLCAFLLKAGAWPLHPWVTAALRTAPAPARLLLAGGPVAMALLGLQRWLPTGQGLETAALACQGLGALALLHALVQALRRPPPVARPGWLLVGLTGVALLALGLILPEPGAAMRLQAPLLVLLGLLPALLLLRRSTLNIIAPVDSLSPWRWLERLQILLQRGHAHMLQRLLQALHLPRVETATATGLTARFESLIARWPWVITALALLGLVLGWLA